MRKLFLTVVLLAGCGYCSTADHAGDPRCKTQQAVANTVIDCGEQSIKSLIPQVMPLVANLLQNTSGTSSDDQLWAALETIGMQKGWQLAGCAANQLRQELMMQAAQVKEKGPMASPEAYKLQSRAMTVDSNYNTYVRARHPGVTFVTHVEKGNE